MALCSRLMYRFLSGSAASLGKGKERVFVVGVGMTKVMILSTLGRGGVGVDDMIICFSFLHM